MHVNVPSFFIVVRACVQSWQPSTATEHLNDEPPSADRSILIFYSLHHHKAAFGPVRLTLWSAPSALASGDPARGGSRGEVWCQCPCQVGPPRG